MRHETLVSQEQSSASQPVPRKNIKPHMAAVITVVTLIIALSLFFISFFNLDGSVEITTSTLRSGSGLSGNYRWVAVDVSLQNPGWSRRITVWVEITCQLTHVSYSKGQYLHIGFRESKEVTVDFTLYNALDHGELTHRAWITYIEQD
jgi:hypothetical protein